MMVLMMMAYQCFQWCHHDDGDGSFRRERRVCGYVTNVQDGEPVQLAGFRVPSYADRWVMVMMEEEEEEEECYVTSVQ